MPWSGWVGNKFLVWYSKLRCRSGEVWLGRE